MRQLESSIEQEIYRVDVSSTIPNHKFDYFVAKLASRTAQNHTFSQNQMIVLIIMYASRYLMPLLLLTSIHQLHFYYNSLRLLLYPQISSPFFRVRRIYTTCLSPEPDPEPDPDPDPFLFFLKVPSIWLALFLSPFFSCFDFFPFFPLSVSLAGSNTKDQNQV